MSEILRTFADKIHKKHRENARNRQKSFEQRLQSQEGSDVCHHRPAHRNSLESAHRQLWHRGADSRSATRHRHLRHGGHAMAHRSHSCLGNISSHHLRIAVRCIRLGLQYHARFRRRIRQPPGVSGYYGLLCRPYHHPLPRWFRDGHRRHQEWTRRTDG